MIRAAAVGWLVMAVAIVVITLVYSALTAAQGDVPAEVYVGVMLAILVWPVAPLVLFAYLIGVRKSRRGAIVAAVLGVLAGALCGFYGLLYLTIDLALGLTFAAFAVLVATPGILSAMAAREIRRHEEETGPPQLAAGVR